MYSPSYYLEQDQDNLYRWIATYPFAILLNSQGGSVTASHLPFYLDRDRNVLIGHMAQHNPHWRLLGESSESKVIFSGPHCYISPTWYEKPNMVPTWNYLAVHVSGASQIIEAKDLKKKYMAQLVDFVESPMSAPWSMSQLSQRALETNLRQIVVFQIEIKNMVGKKKLSQNNSKEARERVIQQLRNQSDPSSHDVANLMAEQL